MPLSTSFLFHTAVCFSFLSILDVAYLNCHPFLPVVNRSCPFSIPLFSAPLGEGKSGLKAGMVHTKVARRARAGQTPPLVLFTRPVLLCMSAAGTIPSHVCLVAPSNPPTLQTCLVVLRMGNPESGLLLRSVTLNWLGLGKVIRRPDLPMDTVGGLQQQSVNFGITLQLQWMTGAGGRRGGGWNGKFWHHATAASSATVRYDAWPFSSAFYGCLCRDLETL